MNEKKRIYWVDYAKAVGIWLVVFAHTNLNDCILEYMIMMFHMPLFFLLSGFFDKGLALSTLAIKKNIKSLMVPYFLYSILGLSICWTFPYAHPELYFGLHDIGDIWVAAIKGMFIMEDKVQPESFMPLGCLWFLPALFICKLLWALFIYFYKKNKLLILFPLSCCLLVCYFRPNYFSVDSAVFAIPFYGLGYLLNKFDFRGIMLKISGISSVVIIISILYLRFCGIRNGRVDLNACVFGLNLGCYYINAVIGSFACILCVIKLRPGLFLSEIGKSSLLILALHPYVLLLSKIVAVYIFEADMRCFPLWGSAFVACIACYCITYFRRLINNIISAPLKLGR